MTKRLYYLDNVKAFAMICIIWGHCGSAGITYSGLNAFIQSWHVPIFFLISGILAYRRKRDSSQKYFDIKKKCMKYLIPYFVFSFIYVFVVSIFQIPQGVGVVFSFIFDSIKDIVLFNGKTAMWFLPCLLAAEIVFYIENKYLKLRYLIVLNTVCAMYIVYLIQSGLIFSTAVLVLLRCFVGLFFYSIGYFIAVVISKYEFLLKHMMLEILLGGVLYCTLYFVNGETGFFYLKMGNYAYLYYIEAVLGAGTIIGIFKLKMDRKILFLSFFGKNTLIALLTHQILLEIIWVLDQHSLKLFNANGMLTPFILTILVVVLELIFILLWNKLQKYMRLSSLANS